MVFNSAAWRRCSVLFADSSRRCETDDAENVLLPIEKDRLSSFVLIFCNFPNRIEEPYFCPETKLPNIEP